MDEMGSMKTRPVEHFCLWSSAALPCRHDRGVQEVSLELPFKAGSELGLLVWSATACLAPKTVQEAREAR